MARLLRRRFFCDKRDRSGWFQDGALHFMQTSEPLLVGRGFQFLKGQNLRVSWFSSIFPLSINVQDSPSTILSSFSWRYRNRTTR